MIGAIGLGLGELKGLQLPSESNWGTLGVFLHGDGRLVLNQTMSYFLCAGGGTMEQWLGSQVGDLDLQNTSDCDSPSWPQASGRAKAKAERGGCILRPVRFLISLPAFNFQPKIIWLKNQMEIREDPKYIALIDQGVCSLEIRKPGPFDGGVYTCKAVNPLGEASVDCRLDVKGEIG